MWGKINPRDRYRVVVGIWIILLFSTIGAISLVAPHSVGASNGPLEDGEIEVIWYNANTASGETLRTRYETELGPIDIYVVAQAGYNRTSGEIPESYILHHSGESSSFYLDGPLPNLYFVVVSATNQNLYMESAIYAPPAKIAEILVLPLVASLIVIAGIGLGLKWVARKQ